MKLNFIILSTFLFFISINLQSQDKIPNVTLKTLEGKSINSKSTFNKNGLTIYSFWATWCIPCINELDAINKDFDKWKSETNVKLVAVSTDDARTKRRVRPLVNGKKWKFEILTDENQDFMRALNINAMPHTIISKGSEIIYRKIGYKPGEENDLYEIILKNSSKNN
jgi:peroxiredoxin|tara:strand:+ start:1318 stop:1818 length:501 start_codon:yes stop_codon:yes gene_type:complete